MQPGRDLDAIVAAKVMGWQIHVVDRKCQQGWPPPHDSTPMDIPYYSTSIADAWEVVEKIKAMGHTVELRNDCGLESKGKSYWCVFKPSLPAVAASPAEAICLAALKACGV